MTLGSETTMDALTCVYRIGCAASEVEALSRDVAFEQTVELPPALVRSARILQDVVGQVRSIEPAPVPDAFHVTVTYPLAAVGRQIPQLLNVVYGNISMKRNVRLLDVRFPPSLLEAYGGPQYGIAGLREMLGVHGRPLLATALKPQGATAAELAEMASEFALGGGDLVKDDHNLHDAGFDDFCRRVSRCQEAVLSANAQTGRATQYFPNIMCPVDELERRLEWLTTRGIRGILIAPFVIGPDLVRLIRVKYALAIMAHPTLTGAFFHDPQHGMAPGVLLGTFFRLLGADASIYPNVGGRFTFTEADCNGIADRLRLPLGRLNPSFPAPAGGMTFETLPRMCTQYGPDAIFLIGGALLGDSPSLRDSTARFVSRIRDRFPGEESAPPTFVSACEVPNRQILSHVMQHLPFRGDYQWEGRFVTDYKPSSAAQLPFRDVKRIELIGKAGEKTAFDLRYFQIEPGGFTSLERHTHTHTVICVRGHGVLQNGEKQFDLRQFDVAYVPPLAVHQLRNDSDEPFGFFCIVDHDRDRPQPV
jgi:ribulose-bisphosphate carboxylase large chain